MVGHDEVLVGDWLHRNSLLHEPIEELAARARRAPVEAEGELVEVVVEVVEADGTVVRPEEPTLQQRRHLMDPWQQVRCRLALALDEGDVVPILSPVSAYETDCGY